MLKNGPNMIKSIQIKQIKSFLTTLKSQKPLRRCQNKSLAHSQTAVILGSYYSQGHISKSTDVSGELRKTTIWLRKVFKMTLDRWRSQPIMARLWSISLKSRLSYLNKRRQMNSKMYSVFTCSINDMINTLQIWELITLSYNLCPSILLILIF